MARTLIEVYLHIVFSTKGRANIIHPEIEAELHRYIAGTVANLDSRCLAINGTENHVHTFVSMGLKMRPLRGRCVTGGDSAGLARARCTRPRATHGYLIDRSAVAE